ncbi:hypothetical protein GCM10027416_05480 [Okibacterium endophyticum]
MFLGSEIEVFRVQLVLELTLEIVEEAVPPHGSDPSPSHRVLVRLIHNSQPVLYKQHSQLVELQHLLVPRSGGARRSGVYGVSGTQGLHNTRSSHRRWNPSDEPQHKKPLGRRAAH